MERFLALSRVGFDRWEAFCQGGRARLVIFAWAFAEAIWWPVIPEAVLLPMAAGARRNFGRLLLTAILGSAIGGGLLYVVSYAWPESASAMLTHMPLYSEARQAKVEDWLNRLGPLAFLVQPFSGIDFKFFGVGGATAGIAPWVAFPLFVLARGTRMLVASGLVWASARMFRRQYRDLAIPFAAGYVVVFAYNWSLVQFRQF